MPQQRAQLTQGRDVDSGFVCQVHEDTGRGIEHPQRDLGGAGTELRRQCAANDVLSLANPREMKPNHEAEPRVPGVSNLSRLGTMGVPLLACTTPSERTRASPISRPTSTTSPSCQPCRWRHKMRSLVRPELPTASVGSSQAPTAAVDNSALVSTHPEPTYKSGKAVQTTGTTSQILT